MFYHGYHAYMDNAYPADELMPLSCKGRWRGSEHGRGDIDDALGNFSLTLVDSLDTLFILGDFDEFENGAKLILKDVHFDHDIIVSVFETNIRMLGGLLSAHVLSGYLQEHYSRMPWYKGELLNLAFDLGYRLLPAFNTTTGIPHSKVNLKHGLRSQKLSNSKETCTACAGTMILEFAALSRLTGDPIFEEKAHKAMDSLWSLRHRSSDLMGTVLNIHNGDWTRRDSGVGAGIDSYYEYCLKAYILLGDERYLDRFNRHYSAVMKYISQGPLLLDVHMHRPHTNSRNFMDALLAFWPGLQVLKGDLKPAVETHEMLYQVMQRHNFLPEAFTTDFQVHWGQHPLRPEFVESTYFLYRATGDPYYLEAGAKVMSSLQRYARVPCGYAAVKDVRTSQHEDQMDSFVLSETFKYLYLLFSQPEDLPLQVDDFVFTTEAHLLPLSLARLSNLTSVPLRNAEQEDERSSVEDFDVEHARSCPSNHYLFPGHHGFAESIRWSESIRLPLKNMVDKVCPTRRNIKRKLKALDFQAGNADHMKLLNDFGITVVGLPDGRVQLLHSYSQAKTTEDAEEGLVFMQEMVEISRNSAAQPDNPPRIVTFQSLQPDGIARDVVLKAGPAQFGLDLKDDVKVTARLVVGDPFRMCKDPTDEAKLGQKIVIIQRGDCMFIEKARRLQKAGAVGGIVIDNSPSTSADAAPLFAMSGDGTEDVQIPLVFLYSTDADVLIQAFQNNPQMQVTLAESAADKDIFSLHDIRVDDEASILPTGVGDLSSDGMVEKLRSEVKRIVVERMKEEAEQLKKSASVQMDGGVERAKGTFIIRMDDKGSIVTESVDSIQSPLESYSTEADDEDDDMVEYQAEEEKKVRRAFITLLRMTVHLLLALQDDRQKPQEAVINDPARVVDLTGLANDVRTALHKVFHSNKADINAGISQRSIDDVLSSFRVLWPENILPKRYFGQLELVLQRLATGPTQQQQPSDSEWDKEKGEKLIQFMRTIRGEFATHLRQFYSKVADRSGLNSAHEPKPNRTPDEL